MNPRRHSVASTLGTWVGALLLSACGDYDSTDQATDEITGDPTNAAPMPTEPATPSNSPEPTAPVTPEPVAPEPVAPAPEPVAPEPIVPEPSSGGAPSMPEPAAGGGGMAAGPVEVPEASCEVVTPCGGDVVGTWVAGSSCLPVTGNVDMMGFGLGCTDSPVSGDLAVTGTLTFGADGSVTDETTTTGNQNLALLASCLDVSGTITTCDRVSAPLSSLGFADVECTPDETTGGCSCPATVDQSSGMAMISFDAIDTGDYTAADNVLTITDGRNETQYTYCVEGDVLTISPQTVRATGPVGGTIVFARQ